MSNPSQYSKSTIFMHWLFAAVLVGGFVMGKVLSSIDISTGKLLVYVIHGGLGCAIAILVLVRIFLLLRSPRPKPDPSWSTPVRILAKSIHILLYIMPLVLFVSGVGISLQTGLPYLVTSGMWQSWPDLLSVPPAQGHRLVVRLLLGAIALHLAGALYHHFYLKDGLINRMNIDARATHKI